MGSFLCHGSWAADTHRLTSWSSESFLWQGLSGCRGWENLLSRWLEGCWVGSAEITWPSSPQVWGRVARVADSWWGTWKFGQDTVKGKSSAISCCHPPPPPPWSSELPVLSLVHLPLVDGSGSSFLLLDPAMSNSDQGRGIGVVIYGGPYKAMESL